MKLTGAQALVRTLRVEGVDHAFGVVGGKLAPLLHAIAQEPAMRYVGVRHEASGAMMAAAMFAGSGKVALALGEMGPGGLNLLSGLGGAFNNNQVVFALTTNQHRAASYPHVGMFMDLNTQAVLAPITKWSAVVHDPRRIPELVRRAFREAFNGRPGPVHLDVPHDVLTATIEFADDEFELPPARYRAIDGSRPSSQSVQEAARLLASAKRPLIVAGGGVVVSGAEAWINRFAIKLNAPVIPTQMALGVVASNSPHFIGHGGLIAGEPIKRAFAEADVILAVGCRFSSWIWDEKGAFARRTHQLININTDATALGQPAAHTVAMHADAMLALQDFWATVESSEANTAPDWLPSLRAARKQYESALNALADEANEVMHPAALARAVAHALPADALVVFDGGHTSFWSNDFTPVAHTRTRFHEPGMSQLGFGLPHSLALKLQHPGRPVFNITGDGSFGFTLTELDTARRYGLNVVNFIHNNAAWGIIRAGQKKQLDFELGTSLDETDYAAIARGFGCHGETVAKSADVGAAIARAIASGKPAVLDCKTRFVPHPAMPMFGAMNRYGA